MRRFKDILEYHKKGILTMLLTLAFIWSLFSVNWNSELIHTGGKSTMMQIFDAFLHPKITGDIIKLGFESAWITLAYAVAGMTLAFIFAFVFGVLASGILFEDQVSRKVSKGIFRGILGFMRAIHELVWALLFVAAVGLKAFAAIFALAIPYGGNLGKIYADILNYSEVWTFMFFLTALVILIDYWSNLFRSGLIALGTIRKRFNVVKFSYVLGIILIIGSWTFIFVVDKADFFGMFTEKNFMFTKKFIGELLGVNESNPAFLNKESWAKVLKLTYDTLQMSIMAIGFATIAMLITVIPAVMPKFITYILYRGEVILRITIIVGFVGTGGLGQQFKLSMSYFKYSEITLILLCYILLVVLADIFSDWARKLSE